MVCCWPQSQKAELATLHLCRFARHGSNLAATVDDELVFLLASSLQSAVVEVFLLSNSIFLSYSLL